MKMIELDALISEAERNLGRAALTLDDLVREHRREGRRQGKPEHLLPYGYKDAPERLAAFDAVDDAMKRLRKLRRRKREMETT